VEGAVLTNFPVLPEELTNEWFTSTLREAKKLSSGVEVSGFDYSFIGDGVGLLGMVIRVTLNYSHPGDVGPASVVIKFAHPVPENRAIAANLNMYEREVIFFNDISTQVSTPQPECYFAAMNYELGSNVVVLEDLGHYRAGDQVKGASVEEVKMIIDSIVPLHAKFWNKAADEYPEMMRIDTSYIGPFGPSVMGTWENAIAQFGYCFADGVVEALPRYVAALEKLMKEMGKGATTLIHGDVRLDNVMFGDGAEGLEPVAMIDWQAIMVSTPMQDIAWLLNSGVTIELRREHEEEFLAYYCEKIAAAGVQGYSIDVARNEYDTALLFMMTYPIIIGGAFDPANARGKLLAEECLRRSTAAVADRGLLARIP
jgi:hypothetical protein